MFVRPGFLLKGLPRRLLTRTRSGRAHEIIRRDKVGRRNLLRLNADWLPHQLTALVSEKQIFDGAYGQSILR